MLFSKQKTKSEGFHLQLHFSRKTPGAFWYSVGTVMIIIAMAGILAIAIWIILAMNNMKIL